MKQILMFLSVSMLVACNSIGHNIAELTGLSYFHDRRDSSAIATDERIEDSAVIELLSLDDVKEEAHFNITSYNGIVLVTGEAETEEIRKKIIANIRIISGVKLVHNEIELAPLSSVQSRSEDSLLTIQVKNALTEIDNMPGFDATRVKVVSENKAVYLMGIVHEEEGMAAAKAAQNIAGVTKVIAVFEYISYSSE